MGKEEDKPGHHWPQDGETRLRGVTVDLTGADKTAEDWQWDGETVLARVEAISTNARATWFALLGLLTFVLITLLSVKDIDFFGYGRATTLPLVNVDVPTLYFFWAAPPLTAAIFGQFHFYLIRHWDILRRAPAKTGGRPFGELAHPWLLTDMALRLRRDGAAAERALGWVTAATVMALTWAYGWIVMFYAWWRAMPAHDVWLTTVSGCFFAFVWLVGWTSLVMLLRRMRQPERESSRVWNWWRAPIGVLVVAFILFAGVFRTDMDHGELALAQIETEINADHGDPEKAKPVKNTDTDLGKPEPANAGKKLVLRYVEAQFDRETNRNNAIERFSAEVPEWLARSLGLKEGILIEANALIARAELSEAYIAIRPDGWKDHDEAETAARRAWCSRRDMPWEHCKKKAEDFEKRARHRWCRDLDPSRDEPECDAWFAAKEEEFQAQWKAERKIAISMLKKPELARRDLRAADLSGAFLPGVDLIGAEMQGAVLWGAEMQGAVLSGAEMQGAVLSGAEMQGAVLSGAEMQGADLSGAEMQGAVLRRAEMQGAVLWGAEMQGAVLRRAEMQGAVLWGAEMQGAVLSGAEMQGADLSGAEMQGAVLRRAEMQGAVLSGADLKSADFSSAIIGPSLLKSADFTDVKNLSQAMLEEAVGNENTTLPLDAETGEQLYVWSCWSKTPEFPDGVTPAFNPAYFLCPKGVAPRKTGRSAITGKVYGED